MRLFQGFSGLLHLGFHDHVSTCRTASAPFQTEYFNVDDDTRNAGIPTPGIKSPGKDPQEAEDS